MNKDREQFRFLEQPQVEGMSEEILADLRDIVIKFGVVTADDGMVRFSSGDLGDGLRIMLAASIEPENKSFMVFKGAVPRNGMVLIDTNQGSIYWDKSLTSEEAKIIVAKIDAIAFQAGLIDRSTGERKPLPAAERVAKPQESRYKVDDVFDQKGNAMPVLPGMDPAKMLSSFDQPDRLALIGDPLSGTQAIVLKEHVPYHERRREVVFQLFEERGIDSQKLLDLSIEELIEIRREIDRRLGK